MDRETSEMNERKNATGFASRRGFVWCKARWGSLACSCSLLILAAIPRAARAQSCPDGYSACDNGACCLSTQQCCPNAAQCCDSFAPFCCGDGTCAVTPSQCAGAAGQVCNTYEVPCGPGCAPAGSDCCDSAGHYCVTQGICTSNTTCVAGTAVSAALLVTLAPAGGKGAARSVSPLRDPPDGTARSCAFAPPSARLGGDAGAAEIAAALLLLACRGRRAARLE